MWIDQSHECVHAGLDTTGLFNLANNVSPLYDCFVFFVFFGADMPSLSGVSDMDYPLQGPGLISVPNLPELSAVHRVPLPPELVEQFSRILSLVRCFLLWEIVVLENSTPFLLDVKCLICKWICSHKLPYFNHHASQTCSAIAWWEFSLRSAGRGLQSIMIYLCGTMRTGEWVLKSGSTKPEQVF